MQYSDLIKISLDKTKIKFKATQYSRGYANLAETTKNIILTNYTIPQRLRQYIKHTQTYTGSHRL